MRQVCTAQNLKKDISELCEDCPIRPKILEGIENQIIAKVRERYDLMPDTLNQYVEDECSNAMQKMDELTNYVLQGMGKPYGISSQAYIWNKERIRALKHFSLKEVGQISAQRTPQEFLPDSLNTDRARELFNKAIQKGFMEVDGSNFKWLRSKALLAYFTEIIYCKETNGKDNGTNYPDTALSSLFKESRLGTARSKLFSNKQGKPRGFKHIDDLVNS